MGKDTIRIGTRGSKLALYQAYLVQEHLQNKFPEFEFPLEIIKTKGDKILDVALSKIGDKGLFTKEMEEALFRGEIDLAVHSLKDLPTKFPEGAKLGAVLKRGDIRDALVTLDGRKVNELTSDDIIATSSLRRKAQLWRINKDFKIVEIRGNVNTRIRKMEEGFCTAMVMAGTGLERLEMGQYISEWLDPEVMIPACSQGAIAIEIRDNDPHIEALVTQINDPKTMIATTAERTFLGTLEGGCQIPVGSYTQIEGDRFQITGFISSIDGSKILKERAEGSVDDAVAISATLANKLYAAGGKAILEEIRQTIQDNPNQGKALAGKVFISTRMTESSDNLPEILEAEGATVLSLPMIEIHPAPVNTPMVNALSNLAQYTWIFFTSKHGVAGFFRQLVEVKGDTELPAQVRLAVIGNKTGLELEYYGYAPHFIGEDGTSADLLKNFIAQYHPEGEQILLSLGNLADHSLANGLSPKNRVDRIDVYETRCPSEADPVIIEKIKEDRYDMVICTSSSTFQNLSSFLEPQTVQQLKLASIGAVTSSAMIQAGVQPLLTAKKSNVEGLRDALIEYYQS